MLERRGRWLIGQINRTPAHVLVAGLLAHFAGARLASTWDFAGPNIIPLWPAVGFVVGLTLVTGRRWWLAVVGAALGDVANIVLFESDTPLRFAAVVVSAQLLQNTIAGWIGQQIVSPPESVRRAVRTIRLVLIGAIVAAAVGGCYVALLGDFEDPFTAGRNWFVGDGLGYIVGAPVVYSLASHWIGGRPRKFEIVELLVSVAVVVAITVVGFGVDPPLALLAVPGVSWIAVRFGIIVSAPVVLFVASWGTWRTSRSAGPFASLDDPLVTTQYFTAAVALAGIFVAAQAIQTDRQHRRLAGLVRALPDAIFVIDDAGIVIEDYTAGPRGNGPLVGRPVTELASDDTQHELQLGLTVLRTNGRATLNTRRTSRRTAREAWFETKLVHIGPDRALAVGRDITERVHVDNQLRQHAQRWRELMNASFQGLAEIGPDGRVDAANSRFASTLGLQTSDVLRRNLSELITADIWPTWDADLPELLRGKRISQQIERDNRSGVIAFLPQVDEKGDFTGAIAISLDTT